MAERLGSSVPGSAGTEIAVGQGGGNRMLVPRSIGTRLLTIP